MPQPLPVGKTVISGPNQILERPELAAQLAAVISNWTLVEGDLLFIYGLLMGDYLPKVAPTPGWHMAPPTHPMARQIFDEVNSLSARLNLLGSLCDWRLAKDRADYFKAILRPEVRKRSSDRHKAAHDKWGICPDYPDALIRMPPFGHQQIWKKKDFEDTSQRIIDLHEKLGAFLQDVYEARAPQ